MNKYHFNFFSITILGLALCGCKGHVPNEVQAINDIILDCGNGSIESDRKCVCDDGSEWLGEGWFCTLKDQKCMFKMGCDSGERHFPTGTGFRNGQYVCGNGNDLIPEDSDVYFCSYNQWICIADQCKCNGNMINHYNMCQEGKAQFPMSEAEEKIDERNGLESVEENDEADIDENDEENGSTCGMDEYEGYICEDNTWVCKSDEEKSNEKEHYCNGIPLSSIAMSGKNDGNNLKDFYTCRYNHWVCEREDGCPCYDGTRKRVIYYGDFCSNPKRSCIDAEWPENAKHVTFNSSLVSDMYYLMLGNLEQKDDDHVCLEESCPCGDGACMKFGKCEDGVCHCGAIRTNLHDGFYCKQYILDYDDNTDRIESGGILYCTKKSGCHTRDGRHYPQWTKIGFAGADNEHYAPLGGNRKFYDDLAYRDALSYHIDAGFDTTEESISPLGECVLDRKDNIRRFSEVRGETGDGAKLQYICDRQSCECGEKSCRIGEICNRGKCAPDSCQAHEKTRLICDVDLKTGQQSFPHPDNPDKCFIFTDIQRFSYLFHGWFMNRIYQDTLAEEIEDYNDASGEDIKYPIESKGQRYYDVMECKGGHRYCHGKNNSPIQIPDNPEGWLCKDVNSLPGITGTDHLKAWVCSLDSGCECGKDKCAYDKACINNQCVNVQLPVEMCDGIPLAKGYECKEMTYISSIVGNNDITGQICVQDMCVCGGSECPRSGLCRDGHCLFTDGSSYPIPPKNHQYDLASRRCMNKSGCSCRDKSVPYLSECDFPCFGDGSLDEDGYCWCGGHKLDDPQNETCFQKDDQYYVLCNRPEGCSCGNTKCPMSTYCAEEKCMDPLSGKPLPAFSGKLGPVVACSEEACPCDTETCAQGQFCVGGKCSDHYYMNISHGKRYNYSFLAIHKAKSFDDGYNHPDYVWNKILTTDISSLFTRQNVPDDEYVFSPYYRHEHCCCDSYNHFLEMDKFRCSLSSGCICGDGKCDYGEECIEGKCVQDDNYIDIFCGESQSGDPDIERISVDKSNCYCNGTVHPFITNFEDKYLCTWKGWQCNAPGGCACGNVRCNQEAYCIKPNLCSDPVVAEEAAFHHDQ